LTRTRCHCSSTFPGPLVPKRYPNTPTTAVARHRQSQPALRFPQAAHSSCALASLRPAVGIWCGHHQRHSKPLVVAGHDPARQEQGDQHDDATVTGGFGDLGTPPPAGQGQGDPAGQGQQADANQGCGAGGSCSTPPSDGETPQVPGPGRFASPEGEDQQVVAGTGAAVTTAERVFGPLGLLAWAIMRAYTSQGGPKPPAAALRPVFVGGGFGGGGFDGPGSLSPVPQRLHP
jgi:hypothetical protein